MSDEALPFVSIIIPIRNEVDFIEQTLRSVLNNVYPADKIEVLVVDGMSIDGTREIVEKLSKEDSRVRMLDNPGRIVPIAMNIGLKASRGDLFTIIGGHAKIAPDFIVKSVRCLAEHSDAWIVGGYIETVSDSFIGRVIAGAMRSPVGVGNARFRLGNYDGWVDTVTFGIHHKWILDKIGYFDEELVRNQDDEFNLRTILAGGKIWMSNSIQSTYYARSSLRKLWRQYFQYGFWRIRTIQKHRKPAAARQLAPMLLILSLIGLAAGGFWWSGLWWLLVGELLVYASGLVYGACDVYRREDLACAILSPLVFMILHFGYGIGCFWGLVRFVLLGGAGLPKPEKYNLSR
jgi:glycosyltransferase involved in cell wall biosynthesis